MKRNNRDFRSTEKRAVIAPPFFWQPTFNQLATLLLSACLMLTHTTTYAKGYSLIINGKAFHKEQPKTGSFNEKNWGLGLQYDYSLYKKHWVPYLTVSGFKDSFKRNSFYAGGGMMRRFTVANRYRDLNFDGGVVAFFMTRKDHKNGRPFFGMLPAFSVGTDKVALNISYVPKVAPKLVPLWFIQLKLSFENFN